MDWLASIYGPIPMSFFEIGMPPVGTPQSLADVAGQSAEPVVSG
jgi:hypothetical protein